MHITVFGASRPAPGDEAYEVGVQLGRALAEAGHTVITGGYGGIMEAVSKGAREEGGHTIGVTTPSAFPDRAGANAWVAEEIPTPDLPTRIRKLIDLADAAIALPGSLGTFTEIALTWNMDYVARLSGGRPTPLLVVGPVWSRLVPELASTLETDTGSVEWANDHLGAIEWLGNLP